MHYSTGPHETAERTSKRGADIRELLASGYQPLDYASGPAECLTDQSIATRLSGLARDLYHQLMPLQDRRDDIGHVNSVIHFTLEVSRLLEFDSQKTEAAVIAAIGHDIGWSSIANVSQIFSDTITRQQQGRLPGGDKQDAARAREEELILRDRHQDEAVKILAPLISEHPDAQGILATIGDHDTRRGKFDSHFTAFLDGDWLWRVTQTVVDSGSAGVWDRRDAALCCNIIATTPEKSVFLNPVSTTIARLEAANTILSLQRRYGWKDLPEGFVASFADEINYFLQNRKLSLPPRPLSEI